MKKKKKMIPDSFSNHRFILYILYPLHFHSLFYTVRNIVLKGLFTRHIKKDIIKRQIIYQKLSYVSRLSVPVLSILYKNLKQTLFYLKVYFSTDTSLYQLFILLIILYIFLSSTPIKKIVKLFTSRTF
jgi:hypothetical protein